MDPEIVHRVQGRNLYYGDGGIAFFMGVVVSSFFLQLNSLNLRRLGGQQINYQMHVQSTSVLGR